MPDTRPTEIELTVGALTIFKGRLATVTKISPGGRIAFVECKDDGGRVRTFSAFIGENLRALPTGEYDVLDSIVAATQEPIDLLHRLGRRAELWFVDPQVGDIFFKPHRFYYLRIQELTAAGALRAELRTCREVDEGHRTEQVFFSSIKRFQKTFEYKTQPGYDLLAYTSLRGDEEDVMDIPEFFGGWE